MLKSPVSPQGGSFDQFSQIVIYHRATWPAFITTNPGVENTHTHTLANYIMPLDVAKSGSFAVYFLSESDVLKLPKVCVFAITTIDEQRHGFH